MIKVKKGKFRAELNEIEKVLKQIHLFEERNYYPGKDFDPTEYRNKTYKENWSSLISSNIYDFVLSDNSLLHFKIFNESEKVSYNFFECPYRCSTYEEFLTENEIFEEGEERTFQDYYEIYLNGCQLKESFTFIRYDFDVNSYLNGVHPVSHIHIGFNNQVRIGIDKILSPINFFSLILRQHYPSHWKMLIRNDDWIKRYKSFKKSCIPIEDIYWKTLDKLEFFLA
ncbi:MAG TPA: DUF2290 domain-containing protein [Hanamia sp.]|nr:DUF2290 domain-containing protein [Hanamia sp.]